MQLTLALVLGAAALAMAQFVPPPPPVLLTTTKSGVLPVLPTPFNGVETNEGAIYQKAPPNSSYTPVFGPAQTQSNLPKATYMATLPMRAFDELTGTIVMGTIVGAANANGTGVMFTVRLSNLPNLTAYGPFVYHIHDMPVPADGNCTSTMGHFDPTNAGEYYNCDTNNTQNCQAGDLSGKHGKAMVSPTFNASYTDFYLSTDPSSRYYFGNRSFVVHTTNATRLSCANFTMMAAVNATATATSNAAPTVPAPVTSSAPIATFTGGAAKLAAAGSVFAGVLAVFRFLL